MSIWPTRYEVLTDVVTGAAGGEVTVPAVRYRGRHRQPIRWTPRARRIARAAESAGAVLVFISMMLAIVAVSALLGGGA